MNTKTECTTHHARMQGQQHKQEDIEQWKPITHFEDLYEISSHGRVRRTADGEIMKGHAAGSGYKTANHYVKVALFRDGKRTQLSVHRLVARAFIGEIGDKREINHKNGIKNDNRVENLEIATRAENVNHGYYVLKNNIRPVKSIDHETGDVTEYASVAEAIRAGHKSSKIYDCLLGRAWTYKGKSWVYADEDTGSPDVVKLQEEFAPYLKEGETPIERLKRERADNIAVTGLLAEARAENERLKEVIAQLAPEKWQQLAQPAGNVGDEREAFEQWCLTDGENDIARKYHLPDEYENYATQQDWNLWQVAWQAHALLSAPVVKAREDTCTRCGGSGEVVAVSYGQGPNDYEFYAPCGECGGTGAVAQQPGVAVPPGYKLVPVEPTEKMLDAGREFCLAGVEAIYKRMLAASPQPLQQVGQWLPIESCPDDIKCCLVNSTWGVRLAFKHNPNWNGGGFQDALTKADEGDGDWDEQLPGAFQVFGWMPLPPAPVVTDEKGGV